MVREGRSIALHLSNTQMAVWRGVVLDRRIHVWSLLGYLLDRRRLLLELKGLVAQRKAEKRISFVTVRSGRRPPHFFVELN